MGATSSAHQGKAGIQAGQHSMCGRNARGHVAPSLCRVSRQPGDPCTSPAPATRLLLGQGLVSSPGLSHLIQSWILPQVGQLMEVPPEPVLVRRQHPTPRGLLETLKGQLRRSWACSGPRAWALLQDLVPASHWLRSYSPREDLPGDVVSGLVIGIILVPQAIAYSLLAGLQPIYSLYTSFYANLIYSLLGTSRHVSVGIFSLLCLMVGQVVDRELRLAGFDPAYDSQGPGANSSIFNSSAFPLGPGLQGCGHDCHAIRVATALTLVTGLYQVRRGWLGRSRQRWALCLRGSGASHTSLLALATWVPPAPQAPASCTPFCL